MDKFLNFSNTLSAQLQNRINISIILNFIRKNEPISRASIAKELNISPPAVSRVINKLITDKYIFEKEKAITTGGKRPILLSINPNKAFVIGIDLGKENIRIALSNYRNEIIEKIEGKKILSDNSIISDLTLEIERTLKKNKLKIGNNSSINSLGAICIGIPADIDYETGKIISASLYEEWNSINFKVYLEQRFNVPVYIENDVNLSAVGEKYYGEGITSKDFVFIEISKGIGAGIIINSNLFRGYRGMAGEIGFSIINTENLGINFKTKGFLEKYASVQAIKEIMENEIKKGSQSRLKGSSIAEEIEITPEDVCEAAINGDIPSKNIIDEIVKLLSIQIINLILVLNPKAIVIGGEICVLPHINKLFIEKIKENIKKTIPFALQDIKLSALGKDACLIGATHTGIESIYLSEFPYKIE